MDVAAAHDILNHVDTHGESWPQHCRQVARVASRLATALNENGAELDAGLCERQALLHDIGRSKTHGPLHGWSGFTILRGMGHPAEARGCLAHWTKGRGRKELEVVPIWKPSFVVRVFDCPPRILAVENIFLHRQLKFCRFFLLRGNARIARANVQ